VLTVWSVWWDNLEVAGRRCHHTHLLPSLTLYICRTTSFEENHARGNARKCKKPERGARGDTQVGAVKPLGFCFADNIIVKI